VYLVRSGAATGLETLVRELGQNPIEMIESAGLSQSHFRDPDTYIAYEKLAELLERCSERCREPLFGLLLAQRQATTVLGAVPVIVAHSTTIGEALDYASKYLYLHASGIRFDQERRDHIARLTLSFDFDSPLGTDQLMQMSVGQLAALVAQLMKADRFGLTLHLKQLSPTPRRPLMESTSRAGGSTVQAIPTRLRWVHTCRATCSSCRGVTPTTWNCMSRM
jgi:hypothetical protein